jgi:hypothetical protein
VLKREREIDNEGKGEREAKEREGERLLREGMGF